MACQDVQGLHMSKQAAWERTYRGIYPSGSNPFSVEKVSAPTTVSFEREQLTPQQLDEDKKTSAEIARRYAAQP